ncbi:MAG: hypothetical protein ACEPOZ_10995 [Marinifilaceae bacterium]|jgi:hypothetical protein
MLTKLPKEFVELIEKCDHEGMDPLTAIRNQTHEIIDKEFTTLENKYREGREGKTWADMASEVYDDVKDGWDKIFKAAADTYYGNN